MSNIFVIDSQPDRRAEVCRVLLQGQRHAEPFETAEEFLAFGSAAGTALIFDQDGAARRLCEQMRDNPRLVPVIAYREQPELDEVVATMQAGAVSYLSWPFTVDRLGSEVDGVARGELEQKRRFAHARSLLGGLTAREREVLVSLISHGTNKAIAKQLDISPRTVEKYRAAILARLGVANSAQAIRIAVEGGAFAGMTIGEETQAAATTGGDDAAIG
ncbi:MAG: response regulator transcription factor [Erythrobacter sp.]|nr:response regulator transcription factor [Erythrobacter sp.]NCQ63091.1 response regulator transcription factor [Alphaproteobacteria bacterium]